MKFLKYIFSERLDSLASHYPSSSHRLDDNLVHLSVDMFFEPFHPLPTDSIDLRRMHHASHRVDRLLVDQKLQLNDALATDGEASLARGHVEIILHDACQLLGL
jgi:hypothetical protein